MVPAAAEETEETHDRADPDFSMHSIELAVQTSVGYPVPTKIMQILYPKFQ